MVERPSTDVEFSRLVDVSDIKRAPLRFQLSADGAVRAAIAARFAIARIDRFEATLSLRRTPIGLVHLQGSIAANVVQECIISLEPVEAEISQSFEIYYSEDASGEPGGDLTMDDEHWPDPIVDGKIDIGEAATEQLGLALDPYPRRDGAAFEAAIDDSQPEPSQRPFAGLAQLTSKRAGSKAER